MVKKLQKVLLMWAVGSFFLCFPAYSKEFVFKWGVAEDAYELASHFKERLVFSLLQENVRYKVEKAFSGLEIEHRLFVEAKLLPCQFSVFFDDTKGWGELEELLSKDPSWFLEEFEFVREKWIKLFEEEKSRCEVSSYKEFLRRSIKEAQEVSQNDLMIVFQKNTRGKASSPPFLIQAYLEERDEIPEHPSAKVFFSLSLREEDQITIKQFVQCLANKNIFQIIADRENLEATKNRLKLVHPLRFIAFALSDSVLRPILEALYKSDFKWSFLVAGFERSLRRKKEAGALNQYVSGFADLLKVDENTLQDYIDQGDFKGMIDYLIKLNG